MDKILSFLMSVIMSANVLSGTAANSDYEKMTSLKESLHVLFNKKEICSVYHTGETENETWSPDDEYSLENTVVIQKEDGRDFKILNLSDTHYSDYGYRAFYSVFNENTIKRMVNNAKPDLIVITGDIVCGDDNSTYYSIRRFTDLMESFGIPWAPIFGNHDDESNCDLNYLADIMMTSPHCLMKKGDASMGVGNYIINIAEGERIVESLVFMDSHHSMPNKRQNEWFKWAADGINRLTDNGAEISVFMHIPLPEYQYAYDAAWNASSKKWNDGYNAYGELHEKICCARDGEGNPVPCELFGLMKESGTTKYVFCGHEHMNNFSIEYEGIRLTYMMKLGKASGYQPGFNGGSTITVGTDGIKRIEHKTVSYGYMKTLVDIKI